MGDAQRKRAKLAGGARWLRWPSSTGQRRLAVLLATDAPTLLYMDHNEQKPTRFYAGAGVLTSGVGLFQNLAALPMAR